MSNWLEASFQMHESADGLRRASVTERHIIKYKVLVYLPVSRLFDESYEAEGVPLGTEVSAGVAGNRDIGQHSLEAASRGAGGGTILLVL